MGFRSCSQRGEDRALYAALGFIHKGFYIDVGAQHPIYDSVSRGFYELGWRGIHIEPVEQYARLLRKDRPDEPVLEMVIGNREGEIEFNVFPDTGLSTACPEIAAKHQRNSVKRMCKTTTLSGALRGIVPPIVHWLKIDVEGFEREVLMGWQMSELRPWVVVIESTLPNTDISTHEQWEYLIIEGGYKFVRFDGLNRFYVALEHLELAKSFE